MMETKELSNDLLKGIMTDSFMYRGIVTDMDICTQNGTFRLTPGTLNAPWTVVGWWSYGGAIICNLAGVVMQLVVLINAEMYYRIYWDVWTPWKKAVYS